MQGGGFRVSFDVNEIFRPGCVVPGGLARLTVDGDGTGGLEADVVTGFFVEGLGVGGVGLGGGNSGSACQ